MLWSNPSARKFIFTVAILTCMFFTVQAQIDSRRVDFQKENLSIEIKRLDYRKMQYAYIYDFETGHLLNSFPISNEPDLNEVKASSFDNKKLLIIYARFDYWILDLTTDEIHGPYRPNYRRDLGDSVDALIRDFNFIYNTEYLTFYATGDKFQMDISDPSKPVEVLIVEIDNSWVRDAPSNGNVTMKLPIGTVCEIVSRGKKEVIRNEEDYWYKIKCEEKEGYIFGSQTSVKLKRQ